MTFDFNKYYHFGEKKATDSSFANLISVGIRLQFIILNLKLTSLKFIKKSKSQFIYHF